MRRLLPLLVGALAACSSTAVPERRLSEDPAFLQRAQVASARGPRAGVAVGLDGRPMPLDDLPVVRNAALEAEVRRIMAEVMAGWAGPRPPMALFISSTTGYTAFANEDNHVFVSLGTLAGAETEDEIAFVLAHEATHVMLGHAAERKSGGERTRFAARMAAQGVQYGTVLANSSVSGDARSGLRINPRLGQGDRNALAATEASGDILSALMVDFGNARISREQETEADRHALDLMARRDYDATVTAAVYGNLEAYDAARGQRAALLRDSVRNAVLLSGQMGATQMRPRQIGPVSVSGALTGATELVAPHVERSVAALLGGELLDRYEPISLRRAALVGYEQKHWPKAAENASRPSRFRQGSLAGELRGDMAAVSAFERVRQATAAGDLAGAAAAARDPDLTRRAPLLSRVAQAEILSSGGDYAGAAAALRPVLASPDATPGIFAKAADFHARLGDHGQALQVLDEGERRFGTREPFLVSRVYVLSMASRTQDVRKAVEECDKLDDPTVGRACRDAMRTDAPARSGEAQQPAIPSAARDFMQRLRIPGL